MYDFGLMTLSGMSVVAKNPQMAFEDAIRRGVMTEETACDYMYMYSTAECDWFKHIITREYIKVAA